MPERKDFLLGRGELLTYDIPAPGGGAPKNHAYTFEESKARLAPMAAAAAAEISALPAEACPGDYAVGVISVHPEYLAKSYYPADFLRCVGLEAIGSKPSHITPRKWAKKRPAEETVSTDIFVSGAREAFYELAQSLPAWTAQMRGAGDLRAIEAFRATKVEDKLRVAEKNRGGDLLLEVALHSPFSLEAGFLHQAFFDYLSQLKAEPYADKQFFVRNLWFVPVRVPAEKVSQLSQYSFVRVVREMPVLRPVLKPATRAVAAPATCTLPDEPAVSPDLRVAVFDGGMPDSHSLTKWVRHIEPPGIGAVHPGFQAHGLGVSSALLFGNLASGGTAPVPFANIDHYRVLDRKTGQHPDDPLELYDTLKLIEGVITSEKYTFINLSIGPQLAVDDDDVHAWTAVLDDLLDDGRTLAAIAVGNDGGLDWASGNARIQVPADCVNGLAVGACDSEGAPWQRAPYSSVGPGRSPGVIKPDVVGFGGCAAECFGVLSPGAGNVLVPLEGTSFASPLVLRTAIGIAAQFGEALSPLAIKALLIHSAEKNGSSRREIGWGRVPNDLDRIAACPDGVVRIVYQGQLKPGKYLRAPIPLPSGQSGYIRLSATFCYTCPTDPQDPGNYTRAGLEVVFRPHVDKYSDKAIFPASKPFFQQKDYATEAERRRDAHKWETTLHASDRFRASSLKSPTFDIHYNARESGAPARDSVRIPYALIITIEAPRNADLYNQVVREYQTVLLPLKPRVQVSLSSSRAE